MQSVIILIPYWVSLIGEIAWPEILRENHRVHTGAFGI